MKWLKPVSEKKDKLIFRRSEGNSIEAKELTKKEAADWLRRIAAVIEDHEETKFRQDMFVYFSFYDAETERFYVLKDRVDWREEWSK